jgi:hypothetical protein
MSPLKAPGKLEGPTSQAVPSGPPLTDEEIDALLCELSSDEIEKLLEDVTGPGETSQKC